MYWLSDESVQPGTWSRFRAGHSEWRLWPLLLSGDEGRGQPEQPWENGDVMPAEMTPADQHDVAELMQDWWQHYTEWDDTDRAAQPRKHWWSWGSGGLGVITEKQGAAIIAPFGRDWPGLCPATAAQGVPDQFADGFAESLNNGVARLGLVAVERSSDALWVTGWSGPANHENDSGVIAAVVRSWEDRFGVRVVGIGPDTLDLSVAAPPVSMEQALLLAAEHYVFCPGTQGAGAIKDDALGLLGQYSWGFWWD